MFKYRFECRSCEKHIQYEEAPLFPTCPICQGALDIEAQFSEGEWTPIPHATLVEFEIERKINDFTAVVSGVKTEDIRKRLRTDATAARTYQAVKMFAINLVMSGAEDEKGAIHKELEAQRRIRQMDEMVNQGLLKDKLDRGMN